MMRRKEKIMSKVYAIEVCEEELEIIKEALTMLGEERRLATARVAVTLNLLDKGKKEVREI